MSFDSIVTILNPLPISSFSLVNFKKICIWPAFPHPQNSFSEELSIIEKNKDLLRSIITNVFPLDKIEEAFETLNDKKQDNIKVLIKCDGVIE